MKGWLIDTNAISELIKRRPSHRVRAFFAEQPEQLLFISVVNFAEIRFGIEKLADPAQRMRLEHWLTNFLRPMFRSRIVEVSEDVLLRWRAMMDVGRRRGRIVPDPDLLIAAAAAHSGLVVVSRNTAEFDEAGVPVLNPWTWRLHWNKRSVPIERVTGPAALDEIAKLISEP